MILKIEGRPALKRCVKRGFCLPKSHHQNFDDVGAPASNTEALFGARTLVRSWHFCLFSAALFTVVTYAHDSPLETLGRLRVSRFGLGLIDWMGVGFLADGDDRQNLVWGWTWLLSSVMTDAVSTKPRKNSASKE